MKTKTSPKTASSYLRGTKKQSKNIRECDKKAALINRSCDQLSLLLATIESLEVRKTRATQIHTKSLLVARIQVLQAVYDKVYFYAAQTAKQIACENQRAIAA